jgi:tetratricopeptide (TPR) repeat protein
MALMYLNKALPIMEQLAAEQPSNRMYQLYIAGLHLNIGRVLTSMSGREGEALDQAQQALAIGKELARLEPTNTLFQSQLDIQLSLAGKARLKIGDNAGAMENLTQALNISESLIAKDPHDANARKLLAGSYRNLAEGLSTTGDYTSALKNLHQAEKIFRDLAAADPANLATNMTLEQVEAEITKWTAALKSSTSRVAQ